MPPTVGTTGSAYNNAMLTAQANKVLQDTVPQANIIITFGAWHYDPTSQLFTPNFPPVAPDNYNLCQVSVTYNVNTTFAPVFDLSGVAGFVLSSGPAVFRERSSLLVASI